MLEKIKLQYKKQLYPLNNILDYSPPEYFSNWDKTYRKVKHGKSYYLRPNKPKTSFKTPAKAINPLNLNGKSSGIYALINNKFNFFYVGRTTKNLSQRIRTHIQKLTSSNTIANAVPEKWQMMAIKRYNQLKSKSVGIDDLKITFFHLHKNNLDIKDLEAEIYHGTKKIYKRFETLNTERQIKRMENRLAK